MNPFEQLTARLRTTAWNHSTHGYSPSVEEMDGIVRWVRTVAELARRDDGKEAAHLLSSPARMLGHIPADHVAEEIDGQAAAVADAYARVLVRNAMEWSDMEAQGALSPGFPSDLFEPLIRLLEHGCQFRLSKGFLEVGDKAIPIHKCPSLPAV